LGLISRWQISGTGAGPACPSTQRSPRSSAKGEPEPLISGSGTTGRLPKWTDGPTGALGDSIVFETAAKIGVGTTAPTAKLDVAGTVNTSTQYNIVGLRVLSVAGTDNTFAGVSAGPSNMGSDNSFFGKEAGLSNTGGLNNSFFGSGAGLANTSGYFNSFFGSRAGTASTTGVSNSFFGYRAGVQNTTGHANTFIGKEAGVSNRTGQLNTIIGALADVGSDDLLNATAIGRSSYVTQSNSLVLGTVIGENGAGFATKVGIGVSAPSATFHVVGASNVATTPLMILQSSGSQIPLAFKSGAAEAARVRADNGGSLVLATLNGTDKNIHLRAGDDSATDLFIQSSTGRVGIGTTTPDATLDVFGTIRFDAYGSGNGAELCRVFATRLIANCSSSSIRNKENVMDFRSGLDVVRRLRPVSFNWKSDGQRDIGLVAEEVNKVEPLLSTYEAGGEVDGVRYNRLPVLLINAVQQQQAQPAEQRRLIA